MIELITLDVDGCMTDGKITYTTQGEEIKSFNVKDGLAIASWIKMGKKVAIITGRESKIVKKRAEELRIDYIYQGVNDKLEVLEEILSKTQLDFSQVAGIGDDLNDYKILKSVGLSFTPQDGINEIKSIVDVIISKNGGDGAIREMIEFILRRDNIRNKFLEVWY